MEKFRPIIINLYISIILSFGSFQAHAQIDSLRITLDKIFAHIDKSQVATGFLEEYGAQFLDLKTYNGVLTDSNYVANIDAFRAIYDDIATAKIQTQLARIDSLRN